MFQANYKDTWMTLTETVLFSVMNFQQVFLSWFICEK